MAIDKYLIKENRQRRGRDAKQLYDITQDFSWIVNDVIKGNYFERKYFSKVANDNRNRYYPLDRVWYGNEHQIHNCAYEDYLDFKKSSLLDKIKKYFKAGRNK